MIISEKIENKKIALEYKELLKISYQRLSDSDKKIIRQALNIAVKAHANQRRKCGWWCRCCWLLFVGADLRCVDYDCWTGGGRGLGKLADGVWGIHRIGIMGDLLSCGVVSFCQRCYTREWWVHGELTGMSFRWSVNSQIFLFFMGFKILNDT